jgi:ABC-2 type transport system ATP-binding protein
MDEAERLCDRVAVIDRGRMIALGTPSELIGELEASNVVEFATDPMPEATHLLALPGVLGCHARGPNLALHVDSLPRAVPALLADIEASGAKLVHLSTHHATLEDVFVSLTGRELRDT